MPIRDPGPRQQPRENRNWPRQSFIALAFFFFCLTVRAELPEDQCPEKCGEVLKACLEASADRYKCIEVAERCLMQCRATIQTGALHRGEQSFHARGACASTRRRG